LRDRGERLNRLVANRLGRRDGDIGSGGAHVCKRLRLCLSDLGFRHLGAAGNELLDLRRLPLAGRGYLDGRDPSEPLAGAVSSQTQTGLVAFLLLFGLLWMIVASMTIDGQHH
jgi:hypothetical protein